MLRATAVDYPASAHRCLPGAEQRAAGRQVRCVPAGAGGRCAGGRGSERHANGAPPASARPRSHPPIRRQPPGLPHAARGSYLTGEAAREPGWRRYVQELGVHAVIATTLHAVAGHDGVVVAMSAQPAHFGEEDVHWLEAMSAWLGIVAQRAISYWSAQRKQKEREAHSGQQEQPSRNGVPAQSAQQRDRERQQDHADRAKRDPLNYRARPWDARGWATPCASSGGSSPVPIRGHNRRPPCALVDTQDTGAGHRAAEEVKAPGTACVQPPRPGRRTARIIADSAPAPLATQPPGPSSPRRRGRPVRSLPAWDGR